ncbi:MAG: tetratricopeptide repeat protein, partial [Cohaesibacteraceae bacterium]|nr:tetratricopeptide repeat protein [Cohaesibacteraceae bacterium]
MALGKAYIGVFLISLFLGSCPIVATAQNAGQPASNDLQQQLSTEVLAAKKQANALTMQAKGLAMVGLFDVAEVRSRKALEILRDILGDNHIDTLAEIKQLSIILRKLGKYAHIVPLNQQLLEAQLRILDTGHLDLLPVYAQLADSQMDNAAYSDAEGNYQKALDIAAKEYGDQHVKTAFLEIQLIRSIDARGRLSEAGERYLKPVALLEKELGIEHITSLRARGWLGNNLRTRGLFVQADKILLQVKTELEFAAGRSNSHTLEALVNYGRYKLADGRPGDADWMFQQVT